MVSDYSKFIHKSRYARWLKEEGRREDWKETIGRYIFALQDKLESVNAADESKLHPMLEIAAEAIENLEVMPSMRALMTAGEALDRDNVAGYNCSYLPVDSPYSFDECMYVLLCGTGVGFSVERQYVNRLPVVGEGYVLDIPPKVDFSELSSLSEYNGIVTVEVADSKYGWASALRLWLHQLYRGNFNVEYNTSKVRPAGAKLNTFGGRASGPEPLEDLFNFTKEVLYKAYKEKRRITSIEAHDIMCKIGQVVVVGGVRRSALISLSNLSDDRMRRAKSGEWWVTNGQRALANNSVAFTEKPDFESFLKEWQSMYSSHSGERGIYNRVASQKHVESYGRRDPDHEFGCNPCSEIILRPYQFCNLTEVVVRAGDTLEDLRRKVEIATFLGTVQSMFVDFKYLRGIWRENTAEERLLGVSLTGIMDHQVLSGACKYDDMPTGVHGGKLTLDMILRDLKEHSVEVNERWAEVFGIPQSAGITCVKPSGTVSQLVDSASGIHPRFAPYYIRRVRGDMKDPMTQFMKSAGIPCEPDVSNPSVMVFSFPQKAPEGAICTKDLNAMQQLDLWMMYQKHWCEHKPSITIYYTDEDFLEVGAYVYKHFDDISGISFLPYSGHTYRQAPYEEITRAQYEAEVDKMPAEIDWNGLAMFELEDNTTGTQELSCSGGVCEIVDIGVKEG